MKSILIAIKPKWCAKIMNGDKTIEVRKNKALATAIQKLIDENYYADIYVYCSKNEYLYKTNKGYIASKKSLVVGKGTDYTYAYSDEGKVLFKFRCYNVEEITPKVKLGLLNTYNTYETETLVINSLLEKCCLSYEELDLYLKWKTGYAIHISDLEIFDKPKELNEFETTKSYLVNVGQLQPILQNIRLTKAPQNMVYIEVKENE